MECGRFNKYLQFQSHNAEFDYLKRFGPLTECKRCPLVAVVVSATSDPKLSNNVCV